jgi:hypothetical protein
MEARLNRRLTDSRRRSIYESAFDLGTGFAMYLPINFFILPLFIDVITNQEIFGLIQIGIIFTIIGLVRKYAIRRWFENMRKY